MSTTKTSRSGLVAGLAVGLVIAALVAIVAVALWPESEADKARADGEQLGQAVGKLREARGTADVDAALTDVRTAAREARDHAGDAVAGQAAEQRDALARAAEGFVGSRTSTDSFEANAYQTEMDRAIDDLETQADDFRAQGPDVARAFWDGFQEGLPGN